MSDADERVSCVQTVLHTEACADVVNQNTNLMNEKAAMAKTTAHLADEMERLQKENAILAKALARSAKRIVELVSRCTVGSTSTTLSCAPSVADVRLAARLVGQCVAD